MPLQLLRSARKSEPALPDLRSQPAAPQPESASAPPPDAGTDIVLRLRAQGGRAPVGAVMEEAAAEIEKLRAAIRKHRAEVWGTDEPDHASDAELYRSLS